MATEAVLEMHAGVRKTIDITFSDNGVPVDVATAGIVFVVAYAPGTDPLITKTTVDGITPLGGAVARVVLEPADTADRPPGNYYFEARVTEAGPVPWVGVYGDLRLLPSST